MTPSFGPLRAPLTWALWAAVEAGLYLSYRAHDARFHWTTHFLVGATFALAGMAVYSWRRRRAAPFPAVWILLGHLYAMVPDLLFEAGYPHEWWMEVFLLHIRSHLVPGRNLFWAALFLLTLATYLAVLDRRARGEAGHDRVRWAPSVATTVDARLPARVAGGSGIRVALLHGMFNSGRYWGAAFDGAGGAASVVVLDLLGFGRAPRPASGYTADAHADAVAAALRDVGAEVPIVVGAHSVGSIVALRLAVRHPDLVAAIVAFAPPLYRSRAAARRQMSSIDPLAALLLLNEAVGRKVCALMCRFPAAAERLVRLARPSLPAPLAADRVEHSWASYHETLSNLVLAAEAASWLPGVRVPVRIVAGGRDDALDLDYLRSLAGEHPDVSLRIVSDAGHDLPLTHPEACVAEIEATRSSTRPGPG